MKKNKLKSPQTPKKNISWGRHLFIAIAFFGLFVGAYYRMDLMISYQNENSSADKFMSLVDLYLYNIGGRPLVYGLYLSLTFIFLFMAINEYNKDSE